jgi:hypothetical protein
MKDDSFFLSKAEVEELVKNKLDKLNLRLVGQKVFTNVVSLWEINGQFIEVTQNTNGGYMIYLMSKREAGEWIIDDHSHCEDCGGHDLGKYPKVLISETIDIKRDEWPGE